MFIKSPGVASMYAKYQTSYLFMAKVKVDNTQAQNDKNSMPHIIQILVANKKHPYSFHNVLVLWLHIS